MIIAGAYYLTLQTHTSGKNLLWSATSTPVDSPASYSPISDRGLPGNQRIVRTSLISSRSNPFDQLPTHNMRRISSITRTASVGNLGSSGLADTTNSNPHGRFKTYSKIEKQELEAQALLRLRELKNRKEAEINQAKAEQAAKDKENIDKATAPATASTIPSITVTAPTEVPKQITQPTPSLFNPAQPADDTSKSADAPKSQPLFGFPSTSSQPSAAVMPPMVSKPLVGSATPNTSPFPPAVTAPVTLKIDDKPASSSSAPPSSFPFGPSPASSSATGTTQPTINTFTPATTVPAASTTSRTDPPSFLFNFPSSNPAPNTNGNTGSIAPGSNTNTATSKPVFSFGLGAPKSTPEQKGPETASQFINGNNAPLGRPAPPATVAASPAPPQSSPFNFAKPTTDTSTPNPFTVPAPQPASTQVNSNFAVNNTSTQPKFNFGLGSSANTSSTNSSTMNNAAAPATVPTATSGNPFGSTTKSSPMVSFTSLTPNGGAGVNNSATGGAPKTAPDPSPFGFKAPTTSSTPSNFGFNTSNAVATSGFGAPNHSNTNGSNTSNVFGSTAFGTKPTENKGADSSGTLQANKMSFNFGVTGGQTSSSNTSGPQGSNPFGQTTAPKPATTSSSLFGALGSQPTNTFGSTSNLGTTNNPFGLSNTASNSNSGPTPTTGFGSQPNQAGPSSQTTNIFGNTGATTSSPFGFTKPAEAPKPVFSIPPTTNGTTSTTTAPGLSKPSFQFNPHAQNNTSNNNSAPTSTTNATTTTSGFAFNFGSDKSSAASKPPQQSGFNAPSSTPSTQSNTEANPNPFNFGSSFIPNNGLSATGIFGSTEQK